MLCLGLGFQEHISCSMQLQKFCIECSGDSNFVVNNIAVKLSDSFSARIVLVSRITDSRLMGDGSKIDKSCHTNNIYFQLTVGCLSYLLTRSQSVCFGEISRHLKAIAKETISRTCT